MKPSKQLEARHDLYANLMDEARIRIHAIRDTLNAKDLWIPRLLQEFCYLQLRMLCEQIALGCLIAQGEIKNKRTLKEWKLPEVMKRIAELDPEFYPRAVRFERGEQGLHLADHPGPCLTRSELIALWNRSGVMLHRGPALKILSEHGKTLEVPIGPILGAGVKIRNLLEQHIISSPDLSTHLLVALSSDEAGGRCVVALAEGPPSTRSGDARPKA